MSKERLTDYISKQKIYDYIKTQINPYGKPFDGTAYEFGLKIIDYIKNYSCDEEAEELKLEKQELLLKLPCKVGDILYTIYESKILEVRCTGYTIQKDVPNRIDHSYIWIDSLESERDYWRVDFKDFEDKCFLTKSDAEGK